MEILRRVFRQLDFHLTRERQASRLGKLRLGWRYDCFVSPEARVYQPWRIQLARRVYIHPRVTLNYRSGGGPMSAAEQAGLRTGEVAEQAGVNIQTLRYYERRGLLAEPIRSIGGHRLYPPDTVALLTVIKAAQRLGFTLDEVADLLAAGRRRHPTPDLRQRAIDKIAEVDAKIADLTAIRTALTDVVDARCDSLTNCTCADCPIPFLTIGTTDHPDGDTA